MKVLARNQIVAFDANLQYHVTFRKDLTDAEKAELRRYYQGHQFCMNDALKNGVDVKFVYPTRLEKFAEKIEKV